LQYEYQVKEFEEVKAKALKEYRDQCKKELDPHEMSTYSLKTQPGLVAAILQEVFPDKHVSTGVKLVYKECNCRLKTYVKQFIRHIRGYPNNFLKLKEKLKRKDFNEICVHSSTSQGDFEQNVILTQWFEKFVNNFENSKMRDKVNKPAIFKRFAQMMTEE